MVYRRRRRQRGGVFKGTNRQRGRGFFSKLKKHGKKYGRKALSHGKRIAIREAKKYAPILAAKGLEKLNQLGNGRQRGRGQRGRGPLGNTIGAILGQILPF